MAKSGLSITHYHNRVEQEERMRPLEFGLIKRIFSYTNKYRLRRNFLIFFVISRAMQLPMLAWAIGEVIGGPITDLSRTGANFQQSGLFWGVVGYFALAALTNIFFHFRQRLALELGESVVCDLRNEVYQHLQRMSMSFYNRTKLGRIISRMTSDIESVRAGVQDVFFVSIVQGGQMIGAAVLMIYYNWRLFTVILAMAPILYFINRHFRQRLSKATREVQESMSRVTSTLAESVNGIRVTQGFSRQDTNAGLFRELVDEHSRYNMAVAKSSSLLNPLLEMNGQFFIAILLFLGGLQVFSANSSVDVGDLVRFFFLANLFFAPLLVLGNQYNQSLVAMAGAERVFGLLDSKPDWEDDPEAENIQSMEGRVEYKNVFFQYEPSKPVLHDISFTANPGESVALVGHTGSGKSSIINLLAKFYLPIGGEVLIDGKNIEKITSDSLHRHMGIVLQQNFLFTGSITENIRFGRPEATDAEVVQSVQDLDCLDIITSLPDGFDTEVGERGASLSLGQRQLICFARAMLADPRILILDEATSSIDTMTEAKLQRALERLLEGRTSFVVAHRLSTIRHVDKVIVLDHGRIKEMGTHRELLELEGIYSSLYKQFTKASQG